MSTKTTTVYKLTTPNRESVVGYNRFANDILLSHQWMTIKYPTLKWTYPKFGKLFAFSNLQSAKDALAIHKGCHIWEAKAEICEDIKLDVVLLDNTKETLEKFWQKLPKLHTSEGFTLPKETVFCNRIRLIKRINT